MLGFVVLSFQTSLQQIFHLALMYLKNECFHINSFDLPAFVQKPEILQGMQPFLIPDISDLPLPSHLD